MWVLGVENFETEFEGIRIFREFHGFSGNGFREFQGMFQGSLQGIQGIHGIPGWPGIP